MARNARPYQISSLLVLFASKIRLSSSNQQAYCNLYRCLSMFGLIFRWISWKVSHPRRARMLLWSSLIASRSTLTLWHSQPYKAPSVARLFFGNIFKLHGLPESIVCDTDVTFTSMFWKELFRLSGTQLCFTSAYHPQSYGQTEAVNLVVEMYLRCFSGEIPKKWLTWLAWAEFTHHSELHPLRSYMADLLLAFLLTAKGLLNSSLSTKSYCTDTRSWSYFDPDCYKYRDSI